MPKADADPAGIGVFMGGATPTVAQWLWPPALLSSLSARLWLLRARALMVLSGVMDAAVQSDRLDAEPQCGKASGSCSFSETAI
jgi:hypothetical protein